MKESKNDWMEDIITSNRLSTSQKITAIRVELRKRLPEKIIGVRYDRGSMSRGYQHGYNQAIQDMREAIEP